MKTISFRNIGLFAVLCLSIGICVGAQAETLIINGSFEDTTISSWSAATGLAGLGGSTTNLMTDVTGWTGVASPIPGGGDECRWYVEDTYAAIDDSMMETPYGRLMFALGGSSAIYQDFDVTVGNEYTVEYYEVNRVDSPEWPGVGLTASISGVTANGTLSQFANTDFSNGWTLHSFSFAPSESGTVTLTFTGAVQRGGMLDNISVTSAVVPEPGTVVLLATGLFGLLACAWRKKDSQMKTVCVRALGLFSVLVLVMGNSAVVQADTLITNGSFEDTTISSWSAANGLAGLGGSTTNLLTDVTGWTGVASPIPDGGDECRWYVENTYAVIDDSMIETPYGRLMFALGASSAIYQDFDVTVGNEYTVEYYEVNRADDPNWPGVGLTASISGVTATGTLSQFANTDLTSGWTLHSFSFAPSESGTATLTFTGAEQRGGMLDNVSVTFVPDVTPDIPGDTNHDGVVNDTDAATLASNWQTASVATWEMGDFNGDNAVNDIDATLLASNWQSTAALAVPEPSTLAGLLVLCLVGLSTSARRRIRCLR